MRCAHPQRTAWPLSLPSSALIVSTPVYALNLFDVADKDEYLAYSRRSAKEVQAHGGREKGSRNYVWHLFDKLEDLRPIFKD
jgi:hypothetical protein